MGQSGSLRNASKDNLESLTKEVISGLQARMAEQDRTVHDLERRVKALEEAVRLLSQGMK